MLFEFEIPVDHPSGDALKATLCRRLELIPSHKYWYGCPQHIESHRNMRVEETVRNKEESLSVSLEGTNI